MSLTNFGLAVRELRIKKRLTLGEHAKRDAEKDN
jgi:hypothetical protein